MVEIPTQHSLQTSVLAALGEWEIGSSAESSSGISLEICSGAPGSCPLSLSASSDDLS